MATISSNDVTIFKRTGATAPYVWKPLVCGTDATLSMTREKIESKTKCGTTTKAGTRGWTMTFSGEVKVDPSTTEISEEAVFADFNQDADVHYAFRNVSGSFGYEGDGVVNKLDYGAPTDGVLTFSIDIGGSGNIAKIVP